MLSMNTPQAPALIAAGDAANLLGIGVKRLKAAVEAGQIGGCWLIEIGSESYVHRAYLDEFINTKPASGADLFGK